MSCCFLPYDGWPRAEKIQGYAGRFGDNLVFDEEIAPYFDMRGRLSYKEMFTAMEEADFFLCLLDPENPAHERYISTGTSGGFQLIYGLQNRA